MSAARTHSRPSKSRMFVFAPVIAAAAIGATLAATQPASAATANWAAIAQKESGGNWHINTGNGYGGGLQISPSTSAAYGGPSTAAGIAALSPAAQIAIAERILAAQGPGAWPNTFVYGASAPIPAATTAAPTASSAPAASAPAASTSPFFTTALAGEVRGDVRTWQEKINKLGYKIEIDGQYGPESSGAARMFQIAKHLEVDGIVGPQTWKSTFA